MIANRVLLLLTFLISGWAAQAQPDKIYLIRHAEKPLTSADPRLSFWGKLRSHALYDLFSRKNGLEKPTVIFAAPQGQSGSVRSFLTVVPLALSLGLQIRTMSKDKLIKNVRKLPPGEVALISWSRDEIPEITRRLGIKHAPASWSKETYNAVWCLDMLSQPRLFSTCSQNLLYGDDGKLCLASTVKACCRLLWAKVKS